MMADAPPARPATAPSAIRQANEIVETTTTLGGTTSTAQLAFLTNPVDTLPRRNRSILV